MLRARSCDKNLTFTNPNLNPNPNLILILTLSFRAALTTRRGFVRNHTQAEARPSAPPKARGTARPRPRQRLSPTTNLAATMHGACQAWAIAQPEPGRVREQAVRVLGRERGVGAAHHEAEASPAEEHARPQRRPLIQLRYYGPRA